MKKELRIGAMAIKEGLMTPKQVNICLEIQAKLRAHGVNIPLGEVAVRRGFLSQSDLEALLHRQTTAHTPSEREDPPPKQASSESAPPLVLPRGLVSAMMGLSVIFCLGAWGLLLYRLTQSPQKIVVRKKVPASTKKAPPPRPPAPKITVTQEKEFGRVLHLFNTEKDPQKVLAACAEFKKRYPNSEYLGKITEIEKICRERMERARQEHERRASEAFVRLVDRVYRLRGEERLHEAVKVLKGYPEEFRDTEYWEKVQKQIKQLQEQIGQRYADDLQELKLRLLKGDLKGAEEIVKQVSRYAGEEVASELRKRFAEVKAKPKRKLTPEEAVEEVRTLFEARRYAEAEKIARQFLTNTPLAKEEPIKSLLKRLEAIAYLYGIVSNHYQMQVGRRLTLSLWPAGKVEMRLEEVHDFTLFGRDEAGLVVQVGVSELAGDLLEAVVAEVTKPNARVELGLCQAWLDRESMKKAAEHFERAKRLGAEPEMTAALSRLLPRTETPPEKEPKTSPTIEKAKVLIKKGEYGKALDMLRRFMRKASSSLQKLAKPLLETCKKKLQVAKNPFSVPMLKRPDLGRGFCEVTYDFSDAGQLQDWKEYNWYSVFDLHNSVWRIEGGALRGSGCRGFLWKGHVQGDVIVEFDAVAGSRNQPNIQVTICDDSKGKNYLFGAGLVELGPKQDVIRFNQRYGGPRTIAKRPSAIVAFRKYHIRVEKKGSKLRFFIDGRKVLEARATALKGGHVGLFAAGGVVHFDNVRIVGRLKRKIK